MENNIQAEIFIPEQRPNLRGQMRDMETGETLTFPLEIMDTIRSYASNLGLLLRRKYTTKINAADRKIIVTRKS